MDSIDMKLERFVVLIVSTLITITFYKNPHITDRMIICIIFLLVHYRAIVGKQK